jgi:hypothetical protein
MLRRNPLGKQTDLIDLLADLQRGETGKLVIEPKDGKLVASLYHTEGKKKGLRAARITLSYPTISGEQTLPIFSRVEIDEPTGVVQQRIPVKYLMPAQRPRTLTHQYKYRRRGGRGGKRTRKLTQEEIKDIAVDIFSTDDEISNLLG